jgi:outer membrane receptor protein involved in Fe transport
MQHIGRQYLDNSENERKNPSIRTQPGYVDKVITSYTVFNAGISYDVIPAFNFIKAKNYIRKVEFALRVNNLFDRLYEPTGNVDSYGIPYWIPAATRNFYAEVKVGF